jgi:minor histocompatibility antigen H13
MMVTVAKSLDVPIKLVFPRPAPPDSTSKLPSLAMLGLGDVVLPGIMIGLALRFDLFLFYLRRQRRIDAKDGAPVIEKPKYFSLAGRWSDHFWTHSLTGRPLFYSSNDSKPEPPFTFPKTYFKASIVGYVAGMLTTLGVMHVWGHAQPALLYLVPGVLISLWGTALVRGEVSLMWEFSEAVEEEEDDESSKKKDGEKSANGSNTAPERSSFFSLSDKKSQDREARMRKAVSKHITVDDSEDGDDAEENTTSKKNKVKEAVGHKSKREVFSFSIEAPWDLNDPRSIRQGAAGPDPKPEEEKSPIEKDKPDWAPAEVEPKAEEPAGKRVRLR